jgi:hypothetical protein
MRTIKDKTDREWTIQITGGVCKGILDRLDIDLGDPSSGKPPLLSRVTTGVASFLELLYAACYDQASRHDVSLDAFCDLFGPEAIAEAQRVFREALVDFFRRLGREHQAELVELQASVPEKLTRILRMGTNDQRLGDFVARLLQSPTAIQELSASET